MKYISIVTLIFLVGCIQPKSGNSKIKYSGHYIPIEGGRIEMKLDSITPLNELIPQLATKYTLYDTYKGYWIGYNELMFSIAVYSDEAIDPLVKYINTTHSYNGKIAALYTLHLIGINCKVTGRDHEKFTNKKARKALLHLLANDEIQDRIMILLIRDPRESDIPELFNMLDSLKSDCWAITSGLLRYNLKDIPVAQDVPETLGDRKINVSMTNEFPDDVMINSIFKSIRHDYKDFILVEDTLINYDYKIPTIIGFMNKDITVGYLINLCTITDYCDIAPNFQYFYKDGKIKFCSAGTAKSLWLNWWNSLSLFYKNSLRDSNKEMAVERF